MLAYEVACVLILAVYLFAQRARRELWDEATVLFTAAVLGENSMIELYGYYRYSHRWHLFLLHVPLLIGAIWPAVVLSARDLARALLGKRSEGTAREAALTGALVLFDAALIEPIAVRAGLWRWSAPGVFRVPLIGMAGWGLFAAFVVYLLARVPVRYRTAVIALAPLATHAGLQVLWWGGLRWVLRGELAPAAASLFVLLAGLVYGVLVAARGARVGWDVLGPRALATGFFAVLLLPRLDLWLGLYALCFVPPHLVWCARARR